MLFKKKKTAELLMKQSICDNLWTVESMVAITAQTYSHGPVDTEVQRDEDEIVEKEVDSFGPTFHSSVSPSLSSSSAPQFGEEECTERVNFKRSWFFRALLHDKGQVEVYHLKRRHKTIDISYYQGMSHSAKYSLSFTTLTCCNPICLLHIISICIPLNSHWIIGEVL